MARLTGYLPTIGEIEASITENKFIANGSKPNKTNDCTPTKQDLVNWINVNINTSDLSLNRCPFWEEIVAIGYAYGWISENDNTVCEVIYTSSVTGILVLDISNSDYDIMMYIDTLGIDDSINRQPIYAGMNFLPRDISNNSAAGAWGLASDYHDIGSPYYRFEFNISKLFTYYPDIQTFTIILAGRSTNALTSSMIYSYKGADQGDMIMTGSPGTYMPSNQNTNSSNTTSSQITTTMGRNGIYDINTMPIIGKFVIDRNTLTPTYTAQ